MNKKIKFIMLTAISVFSLKNCFTRNSFWDGFEDVQASLENTRQNIDKMFSEINKEENQTYTGKTNIFENQKGDIWGLEFYIPGYTKEEISIKIDKNGVLNICAQAKKEEKENKEDKDKKYIYKSQSFSARSYVRAVKLPDFVDFENSKKIETSYDEKTGKLEIKFPKKEIEDKKEDVIELKIK